jgi:hypothetical protein
MLVTANLTSPFRPDGVEHLPEERGGGGMPQGDRRVRGFLKPTGNGQGITEPINSLFFIHTNPICMCSKQKVCFPVAHLLPPGGSP